MEPGLPRAESRPLRLALNEDDYDDDDHHGDEVLVEYVQPD